MELPANIIDFLFIELPSICKINQSIKNSMEWNEKGSYGYIYRNVTCSRDVIPKEWKNSILIAFFPLWELQTKAEYNITGTT